MKKLFAFVAWVSLLAPLAVAAEEYALEPPPASLAGDTVIAQYGDERVTLGDFWGARPLRALAILALARPVGSRTRRGGARFVEYRESISSNAAQPVQFPE